MFFKVVGIFSKTYFLNRLRKLIPDLQMDDIEPARCGIRAMALGPEGDMLDDFKIEYPTGSGKVMTIDDVAHELSMRLTKLFLRNEKGERPAFGKNPKLQHDPHFRDYVLFHEYFHGDSGRGVGASHQTGWTGLVAKLLMPRAVHRVDDGDGSGHQHPHSQHQPTTRKAIP